MHDTRRSIRNHHVNRPIRRGPSAIAVLLPPSTSSEPPSISLAAADSSRLAGGCSIVTVLTSGR